VAQSANSHTFMPMKTLPRVRARLASCLAALGALIGAIACGPRPPADSGRPPGAPLAGLSPAELARFTTGKAMFEREFSPAEGLGPLFNERRCSACHDLPATGGTGAELVTRVSRFEGARCDLLRDQGGPNIQRHATPLLQALHIMREEVPKSANEIAQLVPPALYGLGLLEAVSDDEILSRDKPRPRDGDGIAGRAARTADGRVGRFGRKAEFATIPDFIDEAIRTELGLTTPQHPAEETLNGRLLPAGTDPAADPEVDQTTLDALADFVRMLAPPAREVATGALRDTLARGERLFTSIGCAACHTPSMRTGATGNTYSAHRVVNAYSDLLLHDLGPSDASVCSESAGPSVWRTAPLMGVRFRQLLLHDGRASSVDRAILLHGREGQGARDAFERLPSELRSAVVRFVRSL
jgi:CxxC motif-containing protein (DUF1111 family)